MSEVSQPTHQPKSKADAVAIASQWQLTWWAFRKHKLAMISLWIIGLLYFVSIFAEFVSPSDPTQQNRHAVYHPPQAIHFIDRTEDGISIRPYVWRMERQRDPLTLATTYVQTDEKIYLTLFGQGEEYEFWGLWTTDVRLFATENPEDKFFLFGADRLGRDMFSRIVHGTRISMSIGLVGVAISLVLGITLGGLSGYYGGRTDAVIQRLIEFVLSLPTIPIWLALAASLPPDWPIYKQYFVITLIISLVGWTELGRVVRGRFLAMKNEDFVIAARLDGASEARIIFRHMLPIAVEPHHCVTDAGDPLDDPGGNGAQLSRPRPHAARDLLGRASEGSPEHRLHQPGTVAVHPRWLCGRRGSGIQLPRRRHARCRGPLWPLKPRSCKSRNSMSASRHARA